MPPMSSWKREKNRAATGLALDVVEAIRGEE
jgi:hypothetical protein